MSVTFNNKDNEGSVSLNVLRNNVLKNIQGIQHKLEDKGIGADFARAAKSDMFGDIGILGSLIVDTILWGPLCSFINDHVLSCFDPSGIFNSAAIHSDMDALSALADQNVEKQRGRKLNDYPEGRRKFTPQDKTAGKKFNLVSPRQKNILSMDTQAELACMYELLDMLDKLENEGIATLCFDQSQPLYDSLKTKIKKTHGRKSDRSGAHVLKVA